MYELGIVVGVMVVRMVVVLWDDFGYAYHILLFTWSLFTAFTASMHIIYCCCLESIFRCYSIHAYYYRSVLGGIRVHFKFPRLACMHTIYCISCVGGD